MILILLVDILHHGKKKTGKEVIPFFDITISKRLTFVLKYPTEIDVIPGCRLISKYFKLTSALISGKLVNAPFFAIPEILNRSKLVYVDKYSERTKKLVVTLDASKTDRSFLESLTPNSSQLLEINQSDVGDKGTVKGIIVTLKDDTNDFDFISPP